MSDIIQKQLNKIEKQNQKYQKQTKLQQKSESFSSALEQKIPSKVRQTIQNAFYKGFLVLFEKGTPLIEKTYDKQKIIWEHQYYNYRFHEEKKENKKRKDFRKIEKGAQKCSHINTAFTAAEGAVLGVLGIGLPDIPIFLSVILKGIYETSLHYGFDYNDKREQVYILRLIRAAMAQQQQKSEMDSLVEKTADNIQKGMAVPYHFKEEVKQTSETFSNAMLAAKFIQGIPLVGVMGSGYNVMIYHKILKYCNWKYKKRYLQGIK